VRSRSIEPLRLPAMTNPVSVSAQSGRRLGSLSADCGASRCSKAHVNHISSVRFGDGATKEFVIQVETRFPVGKVKAVIYVASEYGFSLHLHFHVRPAFLVSRGPYRRHHWCRQAETSVKRLSSEVGDAFASCEAGSGGHDRSWSGGKPAARPCRDINMHFEPIRR